MTTEAAPSPDPVALLRRLVAVCDAASMVWTDPVPEDSMNALHDAKEYLAAAAPSLLQERDRLPSADELGEAIAGTPRREFEMSHEYARRLLARLAATPTAEEPTDE